MAYILPWMGSDPVGEIFMTPPDKEGNSGLYAHYYSGGTVKMISFGKTKESPDEGSPIDRLVKLEDLCLYLLQWLKNTMSVVDGLAGSSLVSSSQIDTEITKLSTFIGTRETLLVSKSPYMITNIETLKDKRGEQ